jgi:Fur family transcriptional regulator, iron response regulator
VCPAELSSPLDILPAVQIKRPGVVSDYMKFNVIHILEEHGIQPSAQRVAVAEYVLHTADHPSADKVWAGVQESFPMISRATVYNTLNLFVEKGLLRELHLAPDSVLFDPNTARHHHFIDEETGRIYDIPWDQIEVRRTKPLPGFEVDDYQVVMRGRRVRR